MSVFYVLYVDALCPFSADPPCELNILRHDGYALCMDSAQVCVLEESNQVGLRGFLQGHNSRTLEAKICLEVLSNLSHQPLEGKLSDEQLR